VSSDETSLELKKLHEELAALQDAKRLQERATAEADAAAPEPKVVEEAVVQATAAEDIPDDQQSQLEELADLLHAEIKDLPTITCLAVFSLGILMGRLMR